MKNPSKKSTKKSPTKSNKTKQITKSEVIDQTSGKPAGLVDNTTVGANGDTVNGTKVNTLPQTGEK